MNKKTIERRMAEYLSGEMPPEEEAGFKELLRQRGVEAGLPDEFRSVYDGLRELEVPEPSENMRREFNALLEDGRRELRRTRLAAAGRGRFPGLFPVRSPLPKLAYALGLLAVGCLVGYRFSPNLQQKEQMTRLLVEVQEMKKAVMLEMLGKPSASERIKAVNISRDLADVDGKVISALLSTLDNDPNVNVRLVAVETLSRLAAFPAVRKGLIDALGRQDSPAVQLALADVMLALNERRAVPQFERLLQKNDINSGVKLRIEEIRRRLI